MEKNLDPKKSLSNAYTGNSNFVGATLGADDETYGYVLRNETNKPVLLALFPGYYTKAADIMNQQGKTVDAILTEGVVFTHEDKNVTCYGNPKAFGEFKAFALYNPQKMKSLTMRVDDASQFGQTINVQSLSPYRNLGDKRISPAQYKDAKQTNDKLVSIPLGDVQMDSNTVITYTVMPGREVEFTWFLDCMSNPSEELRRAAARAAAKKQ